MMNNLTIEYACHFKRSNKQKKLVAGKKPKPKHKLPGVTKMLALAHYYQKLLDDTVIVKDYAEIATFTGVSWARITQIMNLLFLAPDIQTAIIDGKVGEVRTEQKIRAIACLMCWEEQRKKALLICSMKS